MQSFSAVEIDKNFLIDNNLKLIITKADAVSNIKYCWVCCAANDNPETSGRFLTTQIIPMMEATEAWFEMTIYIIRHFQLPLRL